MDEDQKLHWESPARAAAEAALGGALDSFASPLVVLASPAWRGVEGDVWRAGRDDRTVIVKRYHPDTGFYVNIPAAIEAANQAADLGAGPKVLASDTSAGLLVMEDLTAPWVAGGLHHVKTPTLRANVIAAKKAIQGGPQLSRTRSVFDDIEDLYALCLSGNVATHNDVAVFRSYFDDAREKIAAVGADSLPCHRDGNTANLMVGEDNAIKLIDFDLSANCDPFEDMGCYLQEFFENDADARAGFEEWHGSFDEGLFQRAMIYGLADDMRWGLIGSLMGATSPRSALEYAKYASWRFMRLECSGLRSDAYNRIRIAA